MMRWRCNADHEVAQLDYVVYDDNNHDYDNDYDNDDSDNEPGANVPQRLRSRSVSPASLQLYQSIQFF